MAPVFGRVFRSNASCASPCYLDLASSWEGGVGVPGENDDVVLNPLNTSLPSATGSNSFLDPCNLFEVRVPTTFRSLNMTNLNITGAACFLELIVASSLTVVTDLRVSHRSILFVPINRTLNAGSCYFRGADDLTLRAHLRGSISCSTIFSATATILAPVPASYYPTLCVGCFGPRNDSLSSGAMTITSPTIILTSSSVFAARTQDIVTLTGEVAITGLNVRRKKREEKKSGETDHFSVLRVVHIYPKHQ